MPNSLMTSIKDSTKILDSIIVSKTLDSTTTCNGMEIDDESSIEDVALLGLCD